MKRSSVNPLLLFISVGAAPCVAAITLTPADLQPPSDTSWNTNVLVGIAGTTRELRIMEEATQWGDFNWLLLDTQNDGYPGGTGTPTNDSVVFIPANDIGATVSLLIPAGANFALLNDTEDGSGSKGTGPNGILNTLDSYLSSNIAKNQTTLSSSQFVKYYIADPTQDYVFTVHDQTSNLGHGCVAFIFIDDDHIGANFDYNDMIVCIRGCSTNTECQDGVFCNGQEACVNGQCAAGTPVNCDDGIPCTIDVCLEQTHACLNKPHNGLCSDGIYCNGVEQCDPVRGCVPDVSGPSCDDGVPCTTDTCNETTHACDHTPNDARCDDGIFCNGKEICHPLLNCEPGNPVNCDDGIACTVDSCNEDAKTCDHVPNNSLCDDNVFCNGIEVCDVHNGCTAGPPFSCSDDVGCTDDVCIEATHTCTHTPNNSNCNDGQFCNGVESCDPVNGCQAGTPPNCADKVSCTNDLCDESIQACRHVVNNSLCDDGVFCNGVEICDPKNGCHAGTPPNCNDNVPCTTDACSEATHSCTHTPNNEPCSDGLFCNGMEFCDPVKGCLPGTPPCPAPLTCLEDQDMCVSCSTDAQCNDGVFCNGVETCVNNQCVPGTPPNCADTIPCTVDSCDPATDACIHVPNDSTCSNGLFCDGNEVCNSQTGCQPGVPVNCDDHVACTADACNEGQHACTHTPNNASCSNGLFCDGDEVCNPAQGCVPGTPPNCNDGIACTKDACNEAADRCDHIPISSSCDDGLFCNGVELCDVVHGCIAGPPVDCSDGVACTLDTCDEDANQCVHTPNSKLCDDGLFCNGQENCDAIHGCVAGTPPVCNDGVTCTDDFCDESRHACDSVPNDGRCSDGLFCNGVEKCTPQGCIPGTPITCPGDETACTVEFCNEQVQSCDTRLDNGVCDDGDPCTSDVCTPAGCTHPGSLCGACCDGDSNNCTDHVLQSQCSCPHCQWSNGQSCSEVGCHNDRVPTISHWGVAILSLLLLIGAKLRFGRRPTTT